MSEQATATPLTEDERVQVQRLFSHPLLFPDAYKYWLMDHVARNVSMLPLSQAMGGRGLPRYLDTVGYVVGESNVAGPTVTETTIFTMTLPGGTLAKTGKLRIFHAFRLQNDTNTSTDVRYKLGGEIVAELNINGYPEDSYPYGHDVTIANMGDYGSQAGLLVGGGRAGADGSAGRATVDTQVDQLLTVTVQFSQMDGTDHFYRDYLSVEIMNPVGG